MRLNPNGKVRISTLQGICNELVTNLRAGNDTTPVIKLNPPYDLLVDLSEISTGRGERTRSPLTTPSQHLCKQVYKS